MSGLAVVVDVEVPVVRSPRVLQVEGIFDMDPAQYSRRRWEVALPLDEREWNIGLIVGPSGSGKTTVARALWPEQMTGRYEWPDDRSVLDAFPDDLSTADVVALLSSVGFSSPPAWLRPYRVLSTGEQFRVQMARILAESAPGTLGVADEYTSVVDRTVARIGSAALAKTIRSRGQRFVAVTCHEDVIDWLQPDWVYEPATGDFAWRFLQRRPPITLEIRRVSKDLWRLFSPHHYLSTELAYSAYCFVALYDGRPVCFSAWLPFPHSTLRRVRREHRTVCLPDYQGVGIGNATSEYIGSLWRALGYRAISTTSNPAMVTHRARSPKWIMHRRPSRTPAGDTGHSKDLSRTRANKRLSAGFEYVGEPLERALAECILASR